MWCGSEQLPTLAARLLDALTLAESTQLRQFRQQEALQLIPLLLVADIVQDLPTDCAGIAICAR